MPAVFMDFLENSNILPKVDAELGDKLPNNKEVSMAELGVLFIKEIFSMRIIFWKKCD
jgi:hypothetical protein